MLIRNLGTLWVGQVLTKGVMFLTMALLARRTTPAEYGAVEYALGLSTLAALVIEGGLGAVGVRRLSQQRATPTEVSALVLSGQLALTLVVVPIAMCAGWLFTDDRQAATLATIVLASAMLFPLRQDWLFQATGLMQYVAVAQLARVLLFATGVVLFVGHQSGILVVGAVEAAAVALTSAYMIAVQYRRICGIGLSLNASDLLQLYREGAAIAGSAILWAATQYVPLFVFANHSPMSETALFGAAHRLGVSLVTFSWLYHFNLYPAVARKLGGDLTSFAAMNRASIRVTSWLGTGVALGLTLCAESLIVAIFGEPFRAAASPFCILVWTFPITIISGHARWSLIAAGNSHDVFVSQLLGAGVALAVALLLVPQLGAIGAGIAMTAACAAVWATAHVFSVKRSIAAPVAPSLPPMIGAFIIIAASRVIEYNPWIESALGLAALLAIALVFDRRLSIDLRWLLQFDIRSDTDASLSVHSRKKSP